MNLLNKDKQDLVRFAKEHAEAYQNAAPFPSISFDNFFNPEILTEVLAEFPDLEKKNAQTFNNAREIKLAGRGEKFFGAKTKQLMHYLNSEPFLNFLQILTGIEEPLISDPYFIGGGQHEIKKGGLLKIHADFNKHHFLKLDRRINVLVYLNKDWEDSYGGYFELWDEKVEKCEKKILPIFNRMAIFSTTDFSYHGHPDALNCPEGRSRKSLALYYYSNGRPAHEIISGQEEHTTLFKERAGNATDQVAFKEQPKKTYGVKDCIRDFTPPIAIKLAKKILNR